jgi:hypothetical protein
LNPVREFGGEMLPMSDTFFSILGKQAAYLDPGSGSFLLQMLIASLLGLGVAAKIYWNKIKGIFGRKSNSENQNDEEQQDDIDLS